MRFVSFATIMKPNKGNEETERKGNRSRMLPKITNNPVCCQEVSLPQIPLSDGYVIVRQSYLENGHSQLQLDRPRPPRKIRVTFLDHDSMGSWNHRMLALEETLNFKKKVQKCTNKTTKILNSHKVHQVNWNSY